MNYHTAKKVPLAPKRITVKQYSLPPFQFRDIIKIEGKAMVRNWYIHIITVVTWSGWRYHVDHTRCDISTPDQVTSVIMFLLYTFSVYFYTPPLFRTVWVSVRPSVNPSAFRFQTLNLSSFLLIFFKLCMGIDIREECFGIANGLNLFINNRVMAFDWCKNVFFLNIFIKRMNFDKILYMHWHIQDLCWL